MSKNLSREQKLVSGYSNSAAKKFIQNSQDKAFLQRFLDHPKTIIQARAKTRLDSLK